MSVPRKWWFQCRNPGFHQCTSDKTVYVQPHKWILVPSTALHFGACCLNFRNITHNNPNARVSQCLQSWLGSWACTRAWWLFCHPGMLWTHCSFVKKEMLPVVPFHCKPENEEGGPRDAVQEWDLCFPLQKIQHFLHIAVVFLELGGQKGALGRLVPAAWERWGGLVADSSLRTRVVGEKRSVCVEHGAKSAGEMATDFPSFSYHWVLIIRSVGIPWRFVFLNSVHFVIFVLKWSWITAWALRVSSGSDF